MTYQGYSGDFTGGFIDCLPGLGSVGITDPLAITIAHGEPFTFGEDQQIMTASIHRYDGTSWVPVSDWTWRYTNYNDLLSAPSSIWQQWNGSAWESSGSGLTWSNLPAGYYGVLTWMHFGARPGIVGPGWAHNWPTPLSQSSPNYCQV